jgi:glycosyltransferase involved in cell wall biosynthesis
MSTKSSASIDPVWPSFDIVLATVGRSEGLEPLLESLANQSYPNFRLIVVDQNDDDRLVPLLERYADRVPFVRTMSARGLSRARNVGLHEVTGDIVAFADDDCWYPADFLARVRDLLRSHPDWDGVTGRATDESGSPSSGRWSSRAGSIDRDNVWTRAVSISVLLRRKVIEGVGLFDETLGLGAGTAWGSGEETDYLLRALEEGFTLHYEPTLVVFHPQTRAEYTIDERATGRSYGLGMGHVLRKHGYPWWFVGYQAGGAFGRAVISLARGRVAEARFHFAVAHGRGAGWLERADP